MSRFPWLDGVVDDAQDWAEDVAKQSLESTALWNPNVSLPQQLYGVGEAGLQMASEFANTAGAGLAGLGVMGTELARGHPMEQALGEATDTIRQRMEDPLWAFEAETYSGKKALQTLETLEAPLVAGGQKLGGMAADAGYPALAAGIETGSQIVGEALLGKGISGAGNMAARAGNRVVDEVGANFGQGPTPRGPQAQEGAIKIFDDNAYNFEDRYNIGDKGAEDPMGGYEMTPVESAIARPGDLIAEQHNIEGGIDQIREPSTGVMTPNFDIAIDEAGGRSRTGKQWADYLEQRGISPEEMNFFGMVDTLREYKDFPLTGEEVKGLTKNDNEFIIRRSGEGVGDRPERTESNRRYAVAASRANDARDTARNNFNSYANTSGGITKREPLPEDSEIRTLYEDILKEAHAGNNDIRMERKIGEFRLAAADWLAEPQIRTLENDIQAVRDTAEERHIAYRQMEKSPAEYGGSVDPSYNKDYKTGGGTLGDYVTLVNQPVAAFGGRNQDNAHYSSPPDEFNLAHNRFSRRVIPDEQFERDGVLYDATSTHIDESQSDLHQKAKGRYGRDLTPIEQAQLDQVESKRVALNDKLTSVKQELEALRDQRDRTATDPELMDRIYNLKQERDKIEAERDSYGRQAAEISRPSTSRIPDANWKDKTQRRVKSIMLAVQDAIDRGDEYVTISNWRQQAMAYDTLEYVDDVAWDGSQWIRSDQMGESWPDDIPESELLRHHSQETLDRTKQEGGFMSEDEFYESERDYYVEQRADDLAYEMEEVDRYEDQWGDYHEDIDDAMDPDDPEYDPPVQPGIEYNGEFHPTEDSVQTFALALAEDDVPTDGGEIRYAYDYDSQSYDNYKEYNAPTLQISDDIITNSDVAGTAKWYEDDYNEHGVNQFYRELGLEPPEKHEYRGYSTQDSYGEVEDTVAIPITDEIKAAMENAPLFNRYQAPSGWWERKKRRDERRRAREAGQDWLDMVELYSTYPRGTPKDVDPRPPILTVDKIKDNDLDAADLLWPDDPR